MKLFHENNSLAKSLLLYEPLFGDYSLQPRSPIPNSKRNYRLTNVLLITTGSHNAGPVLPEDQTEQSDTFAGKWPIKYSICFDMGRTLLSANQSLNQISQISFLLQYLVEVSVW
jgi:hypothetical protein